MSANAVSPSTVLRINSMRAYWSGEALAKTDRTMRPKNHKDSTDSVEKRIAEHVSGSYPGYTKTRLPVELVYIQEFASRDEAFNAEHQIKKWNRKKKEALIENDWNSLKLLAKKKFY